MLKPIWELRNLKEAATRSEFYQFMNVALKDLLFKAYKEARSTYEQLVTFEDSLKDKEGYPSIGALSLPTKVLSGEAFSERQIGKKDYVEITNFKYGEIIAITRELLDDDQTKEIKRQPLDLGNAHKKFEDKTVYSILNGNATGYDSQAIFSLNHPGVVGGGAIAANDNLYTNVTLTANALATVLGIIAGWTGATNEDILDVTALDVVVPQNLKQTGIMLTQSNVIAAAYAAGVLGPAASIGAAKNPLRDHNLNVIASARLDKTSTTDWYVKTDFPGLVFQWRDRLELMRENEASGVAFEREVYRWKSRVRFGLKMINWRWGMKVS